MIMSQMMPWALRKGPTPRSGASRRVRDALCFFSLFFRHRVQFWTVPSDEDAQARDIVDIVA